MRLQARIASAILFALCSACGGRASEPEDPAAPVDGLPSSLEVLELRRRIGWDALPAGSIGCDPDDYSLRLKVNFELRMLVWVTCYATPTSEATSSSSVTLADVDIARVQDAYAALRVSSAAQCTPSDRVFTLDLSPEHGMHLLYGDDEHSGCPLTGFVRAQYVAGLDQLFEVLVSLTMP